MYSMPSGGGSPHASRLHRVTYMLRTRLYWSQCVLSRAVAVASVAGLIPVVPVVALVFSLIERRGARCRGNRLLQRHGLSGSPCRGKCRGCYYATRAGQIPVHHDLLIG